MHPSTKYSYERLWQLNDHADLQNYGPDLLIQDVENVVGALATAERELTTLRTQLAAAELRSERMEKITQELISAADSGEWHLSEDCEVEGRALDCKLCQALTAARAALEGT